MLTREIADRLIEQFENMSEADRDALFERAGVRFLADNSDSKNPDADANTLGGGLMFDIHCTTWADDGVEIAVYTNSLETDGYVWTYDIRVSSPWLPDSSLIWRCSEEQLLDLHKEIVDLGLVEVETDRERKLYAMLKALCNANHGIEVCEMSTLWDMAERTLKQLNPDVDTPKI